MTLPEFYEKYPAGTMRLSTGKDFTYRYHKNENADTTLVLLTGGIGLSDLFYLHFDCFAGDFSVMTFDYQIQFADNREFAAAVAELLERLGVRAWLVGQSLGGIVAQIIAKNHPQVVEGLVLSNTCSLAGDMETEAYEHLMGMIRSEERSKRMLKWMPFGLFKRLIKMAVMKKMGPTFTGEEKALMEGLCDAMMTLLTREYELHMADFLIDAKNHFGMTPADFARWSGRVLLILSEDDRTFNQACKDSLVGIMPAPAVVTDILGGHLALLVRLEQYARTVTNFIAQAKQEPPVETENTDG